VGRLAGRLGAEVTLMHVVHVPASFRASADVTLDGVVERERREAENHLGRVAGSLLVLGSHGRTGWRAAVLGSVARRVVALTEGPVLVVRPAAAAPP
jgi:hypothetical protein